MREEFESYLSLFDLEAEQLEFPLLDVGAGDGDFVQYCRQVLGHADTFGLDISSEEIPHAGAVIIGDALSMPFENDSFKMVVAKNLVTVLITKGDKAGDLVDEMLRALQKGGRLIFDFKTEQSINEWEKEYRHLFPEEPFDEEEIREEVKRAHTFAVFLEKLKETVSSISFPKEGVVHIIK